MKVPRARTLIASIVVIAASFPTIPAIGAQPTPTIPIPPTVLVDSPNAKMLSAPRPSVPQAPLLPGNPQAGAIIETFDGSPLDLWRTVSDANATWTAKEGRLQQDISDAPSDRPALFVTTDNAFQDGFIETYFYATSGNPVGTVVRGSDAGYYRISLFINVNTNQQPKAKLEKVSTGKTQTLATASLSTWPGYSPEQWTLLNTTVIGNRINVSVDGREIISATDPNPLTEGWAGVWATADRGASFDNIRIQPAAPSGKVVPSQAPDLHSQSTQFLDLASQAPKTDTGYNQSPAPRPEPPSSPNSWINPITVSNLSGYQNSAGITASPVDGTVDLVWPYTDGGTETIYISGNSSFGGPFTNYPINSDGVNLVGPASPDRPAITHDNLGRTHFLYWKWPSGDNLCDHYGLVDANHNILANEVIPNSCDGVPRKVLAIAVDNNLTAHIVMSRATSPYSMKYWQRTSSGTWTVQGENVPQICAPGDIAITVSAGGTVMAGWKDCPQSGTGTDIFTGIRLSANNWLVENISASCCTPCPNQSSAYAPVLRPSPDGGIRAVWADGRCGTNQPDIYYREWAQGVGWTGQPTTRIVNNTGQSYWPALAVDNAGEAYVFWEDDTGRSTGNFILLYAHGHSTTFSTPTDPFVSWEGNAFVKEPSLDFSTSNYTVHLSFGSNFITTNKNNFYSYMLVPPPCPSELFTDVCPGAYYYTPVANLYAANVIGGHSTSPPCPNSLWISCFLPGSNATRAQVAKIVMLGAGLSINTTGGPHFEDVPGGTFYNYIETLYNHVPRVIGGYPCGGPGEPCISGKPYFRPNDPVTRSQLTKMDTLAFSFPINTTGGPHFEDVPGGTFYNYIETLYNHVPRIIDGYPCGGPGEPCISGKPYFRPNNNVTRGQIAKIIDLSR